MRKTGPTQVSTPPWICIGAAMTQRLWFESITPMA